MRVPSRIPLTGALAIALMLAGCGGGGGGGGNEVDETIPDSAAASSDDEAGTVYPLREGRYRMGYSAADCEDVHITITGADGVAAYDATPRAFTVPVRLETGEYTIAVTSECDEWTVDLALF